jgi:hypothetical protein
MEPNNARVEQRAQVAKDLGRMLRRQARRKWSEVRTAERNEHGHHVWRFRPGTDGNERFLHVSHGAMEQNDNPSRLLFEQLREGRWLDRLERSDNALRLAEDGKIVPWSMQ